MKLLHFFQFVTPIWIFFIVNLEQTLQNWEFMQDKNYDFHIQDKNLWTENLLSA